MWRIVVLVAVVAWLWLSGAVEEGRDYPDPSGLG